jgi:hypothetical protein
MKLPDIQIVNNTPLELAQRITRTEAGVEIVLSLPPRERDRLRALGIVVDTCAHGQFLDQTCPACLTVGPALRKFLRGEHH